MFCSIWLVSPDAVSYTHLDVYKRQVLCLIYPYCQGTLAQKVPNTSRRGGPVDTFHAEVLDYFLYPPRRSQLRLDWFYRYQAVSYTHLDVYKRQVYNTASNLDFHSFLYRAFATDLKSVLLLVIFSSLIYYA